MAQLREFVYLDTESLNNNLSSLGKGIPSEITHANENQTEKGGEAGGRIAGIGGGGKYINMDREEVETTLDITAPYRFQDLMDEIGNNEIAIKENPDPRSLSRADLVKVEGEVCPMSILKFEMALDAFNIFSDKEFNKALQKVGESPMITSTEMEQMNALSRVLERFSGNEYPLRIEASNSTYCTKLHSSNMRQSIFDAFGEREKYVLFGRVKRHVPVGKEWNPIHALNIIEQYVPGDVGDEFIMGLRDTPDDINISIEDEDIRVKGHTAVIEPIAMYW